MAGTSVTIRIVITNEWAVEAFGQALEILQSAATDKPWDTEIAEALELLQSAADSLQAITENRDNAGTDTE